MVVNKSKKYAAVSFGTHYLQNSSFCLDHTIPQHPFQYLANRGGDKTLPEFMLGFLFFLYSYFFCWIFARPLCYHAIPLAKRAPPFPFASCIPAGLKPIRTCSSVENAEAGVQMF